MEFDKTVVDAMFKEAIPSVVESLKKELTANISWEAKEVAMQTIREYVVDFVKKEILPTIGEILLDEKEGMTAFGKPLSDTMSKGLADSLAAAFQENMKNSWQRKKIFEALLG